MREAMIAGLVSYEKKHMRSTLPKTNNRFTPLHQSSTYNYMSRQRKKAKNVSNWFKEKRLEEESPPFHPTGRSSSNRKEKKSKKDDTPTTTVSFVPNTKGGKLVKRLQQEENKLARLTGFRVRYV